MIILNIPIKVPEKTKTFIDLVDKILQAKKNGKNTAALEAQIDTMVYQLYDLTTRLNTSNLFYWTE
jgi:hypothetical protein